MNKKELKLEVLSSVVTQMKVKGSFAFIEISHMHEGVEYTAFDFAKWSTQDMKIVEKATKIYRFILEQDCGCRDCRLDMQHLSRLIEKYNWSDEKGLKIATGRAVGDIVKQILKAKKEEKSSDGQKELVWDYQLEQMSKE